MVAPAGNKRGGRGLVSSVGKGISRQAAGVMMKKRGSVHRDLEIWSETRLERR